MCKGSFTHENDVAFTSICPNEIQMGPHEIQMGPNEIQMGSNEIQMGSNEIQFAVHTVDRNTCLLLLRISLHSHLRFITRLRLILSSRIITSNNRKTGVNVLGLLNRFSTSSVKCWTVNFCIHASKGPVIIISQSKSIYNSLFKESYSHSIHACFPMVASNGVVHQFCDCDCDSYSFHKKSQSRNKSQV